MLGKMLFHAAEMRRSGRAASTHRAGRAGHRPRHHLPRRAAGLSRHVPAGPDGRPRPGGCATCWWTRRVTAAVLVSLPEELPVTRRWSWTRRSASGCGARAGALVLNQSVAVALRRARPRRAGRPPGAGARWSQRRTGARAAVARRALERLRTRSTAPLVAAATAAWSTARRSGARAGRRSASALAEGLRVTRRLARGGRSARQASAGVRGRRRRGQDHRRPRRWRCAPRWTGGARWSAPSTRRGGWPTRWGSPSWATPSRASPAEALAGAGAAGSRRRCTR